MVANTLHGLWKRFSSSEKLLIKKGLFQEDKSDKSSATPEHFEPNAPSLDTPPPSYFSFRQ